MIIGILDRSLNLIYDSSVSACYVPPSSVLLWWLFLQLLCVLLLAQYSVALSAGTLRTLDQKS
jgi:hypothetical protein